MLNSRVTWTVQFGCELCVCGRNFTNRLLHQLLQFTMLAVVQPITRHLTMLCCHCVLILPVAIGCFQTVYHCMPTNSSCRDKTCSFRESSHTFRLHFPNTCVPKLSPELYLHSLLLIHCVELDFLTILLRSHQSFSITVTCFWQQRITSTTTKSCKDLIHRIFSNLENIWT